MQVKVVDSWRGGSYTVKLTQGVQSFRLCYEGNKSDVEWYAKMFRKALKKHDKEKSKCTD